MVSVRKEFLTIPYSMVGKGYSANAMVLYGLIYKMSASDFNGCYPNNSYFAKTLGVSERTVSRLLHELLEHKAISIRQDAENKNLRWIKPLITSEVPYYVGNTEPNREGDGGFTMLNGGFTEL